MESRQEPRFEADQEITVILLGSVEIIFPARIVNLSGKGMCLQTSQSLVPGAAVKIELADTLVLAEVIYCRPQESGYQVGIALEQALYHTRELAALAVRLLGDGNRAISPVGRQ